MIINRIAWPDPRAERRAQSEVKFVLLFNSWLNLYIGTPRDIAAVEQWIGNNINEKKR